MKKALVIDKKDNVAIALQELKKGDSILSYGQTVTVVEDIDYGHKIALQSIEKGDDVIKYGFAIGKAIDDIKKGSWVHSHNLKSNLDKTSSLQYREDTIAARGKRQKLYFEGYLRKDGFAGIRNDIWIIPAVGCVNNVGKVLENNFRHISGKQGIDSITCLTHQYGCSQLGEDLQNITKILCAIAKNPNASGVLFVTLGCENNTIDLIKRELKDYDRERILFLECQKEDDEIQKGKELINKLIEKASEDRRVKIPISKLVIGLKCGGSDAMSGISANPVIGKFCDKAIGLGASAVLTEIPEMFGAEQLLFPRCKNKEVFGKFEKVINSFKRYYLSNGMPVYENPSPGNKKGGLTTLEEKSLGCVTKGGSREIKDIIEYGQRLNSEGLNILSAPGNDLIASTALVAAGAQIILFSTGRGTPYGSIVPTIKISSNNNLYHRKNNWTDFNAGGIISGDKSIDALADELMELVLSVVSGKKLISEKLYPYKEIAFFKTGVTL